MERLPLHLSLLSPELHQRHNAKGSPLHHTGTGGTPPSLPSSNAAVVSATDVAISKAVAAANIPSSLVQQLPFAYDIKHTIPLNLTTDPRLWSRNDLVTFLQWCEREFELPSFDISKFQMNGKALCLLTKSDLESRSSCSGDVIHNALQMLMSSPLSKSPLTPHIPFRIPSLNAKGFTASHQQGAMSVTLSPAPLLDGHAGCPQDHGRANSGVHSSPASSSNGSAGNDSDYSEYDHVDQNPERSPKNQSAESLIPPPRRSSNAHQNYTDQQLVTNATNYHESTHIHGNSNGNTANSKKSSSFHQRGKLPSNSNSEGGNGRLLWDFLQQLLNDPSQRYRSFITWINIETGMFKIVNPSGLARLWGIQKSHLSMNYEKMSRALRYYYRVNILRKVPIERLCYQFLKNPDELKSIKSFSMLATSAKFSSLPNS